MEIIFGLLAWAGLFLLVRKVIRDRRARKAASVSS